jgi:hypothetical protein
VSQPPYNFLCQNPERNSTASRKDVLGIVPELIAKTAGEFLSFDDADLFAEFSSWMAAF